MRRLLFVLPVLVVLALAGFFARALWSGKDPSVLPSALIDKPMPAFDLPGLSAGALKGQVAVVNFFALVRAVPGGAPAADALRRAGVFRSTASPTRTTWPPPRASWRSRDPFRRIGADRDGRTAIDFGVYGVPETYVIDRDGHIRKRFVGPLTPEAVDSARPLLLLRQLNAGS